MKTIRLNIVLMVLLSASIFGQSITNTISSGGSFIIKDGSTTFFSLPQNTGKIILSNGLALPVSFNAEIGVIYKGTDRFIHDYHGTGTAGQNTFVGLNAGNFTMYTGYLDYGSYNTGVGYSALSANNAGAWNSAFGTGSLQNNTGGFHNSAVGTGSLYSNINGSENSALGMNSLYLNTTGNNNSAVGYLSLNANTTGSWNSAFGSTALYSNSTGTRNSAFGDGSLQQNTTSSYNAAFGQNSLFSQTTGNNNSAFGWSAGSNVATGSNLTLIGANAQASSPSANNEITLGNSSVGALRCNVQSITSLSDVRDKKNIKDLPVGIEFIMQLKPRQFNWDKREWYDNKVSDGSKMHANPTAGFIAQELDSVQTSGNTEWLNLVLKSNPDKLEATYGNLLPVIVKAIQDLKKENDELRDMLARYMILQAIITKELANMKEINSGITKVSLEQR